MQSLESCVQIIDSLTDVLEEIHGKKLKKLCKDNVEMQEMVTERLAKLSALCVQGLHSGFRAADINHTIILQVS